MKTKCIFCKLEEEQIDEQTKILTTALKLNPNAKSTDYLEILSIVKGPTCSNGKRHKFMFHEEFNKNVGQLVTEQKTLEDKIKVNTEEDEKLRQKIVDIGEQMKKLADSRIEAIEKRNTVINEISTFEREIEHGKQSLKELTGTDNFEMWS